MSVRALRRGTMAGRGGAPAVTNVLSLPGNSANYVSTPDSAAVSITGSIDLRAKVAPTDWTAGAAVTLIIKWGAGGSRSYAFDFQSDNTLLLMLSQDGNSVVSVNSGVPVAFADGTPGWIRATWDNAADEAKFYTSTDGVAWTQLGTTKAAALASLHNNAQPVEIGAFAAGVWDRFAGKIYKAEIRDGINGPVVASFDATAVTKLGTRNPTTYTAPTGEVWTVNGSAWDWVAP